MSNTKRIFIGFGVIALGVCAALPFRHPPGQRNSMAVVPVPEELELGKDLPLQVPGQKLVSQLQTPASAPTLSREPVSQPAKAAEASVAQEPMSDHQVDYPPALPDEYQPLFPARGKVRNTTGVVIGPSYTQRDSKPLRHHIIHDGDTLASLAQRYLGSADRADEIFQANRDVLTAPELLPIGVEIVLPARQNTDTPHTPTDSRRRRSESAVSVVTPLEPLPSNLLRGS